MRTAMLLLAASVLAACQATTGDIAYAPVKATVPGSAATISGVTTQDIRGIGPYTLAVTRGIYGKPVQLFQTNAPVGTEVAQAFAAGLDRRGMVGSRAPYRMIIMLRRLEAESSGVDRQAEIDLDLLVVNASGGIVYKRTYARTDDRIVPLAGLGTLVPLTRRLLDAAVDTLLDRSDLRALLGRAGPAPVLPTA